jgi:hypothetical protein
MVFTREGPYGGELGIVYRPEIIASFPPSSKGVVCRYQFSDISGETYVVAQFIKQNSQGPNVDFLVDSTARVQVTYFRSTVLDGCDGIDFSLDAFDLGRTQRH